MRTRTSSLLWVATLAGALTLTAAGCRQDMHDQAKYEPLEASTLFADGAASRPLVAGTVPRGFLREDDALYRGTLPGGEFVTRSPVPVTLELLARGRNRFDIFCSPCHGRLGDGNGMIVQRGYKRPSSFHSDRLREAAPGYYFTVMSNGFGQMASYASQLGIEDRWAVAAYLRALQLSRATPREALSEADLAALADASASASSEAAEAAH